MNKIKDRTNETNIATNGQQMKIIAYNGSHDINIQFEDGTIVKHKKYESFKKGTIRNPNINSWNFTNRTNEESKAKNGQMMRIIHYQNNNDIDIQFEDKTIVKHTSYDLFKRGTIKNPNFIKYLNETNIASNGQTMTIINSKSSADIDVKFDDGTIIKHKRYSQFKQGRISNPKRPVSNSLLPYITKDNIEVTGIAYRYEHQVNMFCKCLTCQEKMILTYDEMEEHICQLK